MEGSPDQKMECAPRRKSSTQKQQKRTCKCGRELSAGSATTCRKCLEEARDRLRKIIKKD